MLMVHFDQISLFPEIDYDITFMKVDTFRKNNGSSFNFYQFPLKIMHWYHQSQMPGTNILIK